MSKFVLCPESGDNLGEVSLLFTLIKNNHIRKTLKTDKYKSFDPAKVELLPNAIPPLKFIFDALNITKPCCIAHLMSGLKD